MYNIKKKDRIKLNSSSFPLEEQVNLLIFAHCPIVLFVDLLVPVQLFFLLVLLEQEINLQLALSIIFDRAFEVILGTYLLSLLFILWLLVRTQSQHLFSLFGSIILDEYLGSPGSHILAVPFLQKSRQYLFLLHILHLQTLHCLVLKILFVLYVRNMFF